MTEFGDFPTLESKVYTIPVQARAVPLSLHFSLPGSEARDFVFVPDGHTVQLFPKAFASYSRSEALDSIFRYVGGDNTVVPLAGKNWAAPPRRTELRFALARWSRRSTAPLPEAVFSVQRLPLTTAGEPIHEIVPSAPIWGEN